MTEWDILDMVECYNDELLEGEPAITVAEMTEILSE